MNRVVRVLFTLSFVVVLLGTTGGTGIFAETQTFEYVPKPGVYPDTAGQLWRYYGPVDLSPNTPQLRIEHDVLHVDTTASPATKQPWWIPGGSPGWQGVDFAAQTVVIEFKLRVLDQVGSAAFHLGALDGRREASVAIGTDGVAGIPMDTTQWHVYRLEIVADEVVLFVDNEEAPVSAWPTKENELSSRIVWGDSASGWSGSYELAYIRWTIGAPDIQVDEERDVVFLSEHVVYEYHEDVNFPWAYRFSDGTIWLSFSIGKHTVTERGTGLVSYDNGETWVSPGHLSISGLNVVELEGGGALSASFSGINLTNDRREWMVTFHEWDDRALPPIRRFVKITMPFDMETLLFHRTILRDESTGRLLMTGYGRRMQDHPLFGPSPGEMKDESYLFESLDNGATWSYVSTIFGSDLDRGLGSNETDIAFNSKGQLVAVARTYSRNARGLRLYQTISDDGGRTWREPWQIATQGAAPALHLTSGGVLVTTYGRPRVEMMLDYTGTGEQWERPIVVYDGPGDHYSSIVEFAPNRIGVFYTESVFIGSGGAPADGVNRLKYRVYEIQ